jgi:SAM-dependent methyltransferase
MSDATIAEIPDTVSLKPTRAELQAVFDLKYRQEARLGQGPRTRLAFGYFNPDDHYEAIVAKLVRPGAAWADVGCGRYVFPSNTPLARQLAARSGFLFGIDPDPNIRDNALLNQRFEGVVEDCVTPHRFDLVTMRMVAEHIVDPDRSIAKVAELLKPGGLLVIYTPNKWSPVPVITRLVPNRWHWRVKRVLWDGEARDTFPTAFKLNTRRSLACHCGRQGLDEIYFDCLDDCRTFDAYHWLNCAELALQRLLRSLSIRHPENCLLGVYRKR